ncbi:MAG: beta-propeller fold lactonase family protein [Opitutaceae bacterium]|nr:beta-propeller fold lactonase family protein [Opitutaceae bacterium]
MKILSTIFVSLYVISAYADSLDVYIGTRGENGNGIYHAKFDVETGKLHHPKLAAEMLSAHFLTLHPNKNVLYAVAQNETDPILVAYKIADDGSLTLINKEGLF